MTRAAGAARAAGTAAGGRGAATRLAAVFAARLARSAAGCLASRSLTSLAGGAAAVRLAAIAAGSDGAGAQERKHGESFWERVTQHGPRLITSHFPASQ